MNEKREALCHEIQNLESQKDSKAKEVEIKYAYNDLAKVEAEKRKVEEKLNGTTTKKKLYEKINDQKKSILDLQNELSCCYDELSAKCQEIPKEKQKISHKNNTIHRKVLLICSLLVAFVLFALLLYMCIITPKSTNEQSHGIIQEIAQLL